MDAPELSTPRDAGSASWTLWPRLQTAKDDSMNSKSEWTVLLQTMLRGMTAPPWSTQMLVLPMQFMTVMEFPYCHNLLYRAINLVILLARRCDLCQGLLATVPHTHLRTRRMAQGMPKGTMRWGTVMVVTEMINPKRVMTWRRRTLMMRSCA